MKRLILVLTVFVLVSAPVIAGIWTLIVPRYQARGEIRVRPVIPRLVFQTEDNGLIPFYDSFVNTQAALIRSPTVLARVLDQRQVRETQWYKSPTKTLVQRFTGDAIPPVERLQGGLSVSPRPSTELVDLSFAAEDASEAQVILDAVLNQYMQYVGEKSNAEEDGLYRQLTNLYNSLQSQIKAGEDIYTQLCAALGTDTPQALVSAQRVRLDATEARLNELRHRIKVLTSNVNEISAVDSNGVQSSPAGQQPKYYEDAEWRRLNIDVNNIEQQIVQCVYFPTHPTAKKMQEQLDFAKELRQTRLDELGRDHRKNAPVALFLAAEANDASPGAEPLRVEHQLAQAEYEEKLLSEEFGSQQTQFKELFARAQLLEKENRDLQPKRELFDAIRQRKEQKDIERNVPGCIEIATSAYCLSKPAQDPRILFTAGAVLLGVCVAGGTAFLTRRRKDVPSGSDGTT